MNVYGFFTKLTHPSKRVGWVETTAYFTGKKRLCKRGRFSGTYPKNQMVVSATEIYEYSVKYYVEDKEQVGWYMFYPAPEPDPEEIAGTSMKIRYKKSRPYIFENNVHYCFV